MKIIKYIQNSYLWLCKFPHTPETFPGLLEVYKNRGKLSKNKCEE